MLPDDRLLVVAVVDVTVDGRRLEGAPVMPDIAVPFDIRYSAGHDPQRDAATEAVVELLAESGTAVQ